MGNLSCLGWSRNSVQQIKFQQNMCPIVINSSKMNCRSWSKESCRVLFILSFCFIKNEPRPNLT